MNLCQCIATVLPFEILNFSRVPGCRHVSVNHCSFNLEISNLSRVSRSRLESENHCNLNLDTSNMGRVHGCKLGAAYDALVGTCEMSVRTQRGFLARSLAYSRPLHAFCAKFMRQNKDYGTCTCSPRNSASFSSSKRFCRSFKMLPVLTASSSLKSRMVSSSSSSGSNPSSSRFWRLSSRSLSRSK